MAVLISNIKQAESIDEDVDAKQSERDTYDDCLEDSHDNTSQTICFLLPRPGPLLSVRLTNLFLSRGLSRGVMVLLSMLGCTRRATLSI